MVEAARHPRLAPARSGLDRALSLFAEVRAGEGVTAALMLVNIFVLLVCYSVIKTVREPLILLGGGAEVRSYAAAGQALLLMGFVPAYSWFASRVNRARLLTGMSVFFLAWIELFALAVAARVPYIGVAFFIWVGIFSVSLVAQFWSFAADVYDRESAERLFPVIVVGMTAGAPLGSLVAARLFHSGATPQTILQVSAALLATSALLYTRISRRERPRGEAAAPMSAAGGFKLVLSNRYLRFVAALIVLLNVVNTTGEYLVARLLTLHVGELAAAAGASFNKQAYIGTFSGNYQFWVNVTALLMQAFLAPRMVRYKGLAGVLLVLPLVALGGYAIVAAGVGFSVVQWIKTAENATDYSIMNTARQLLWVPTSREEKYKAKQAIDTFCMRGGDVLSAGVVYLGSAVLHLSVPQFAAVNVLLTLGWLAVALRIVAPARALPRLATARLAPVAAAAVLVVAAVATPAAAQETREAELAAQKAAKATRLHEYEPDPLERRLELVETIIDTRRSIYPFIGSVYDGGGLAAGPGYRTRFKDTGRFDAHAAYSVRQYKKADVSTTLPAFAHDRASVQVHASWLDAPAVEFYGVGNDSLRDNDTTFSYRSSTVGVTGRVQASQLLAVGAGLEASAMRADSIEPTYRHTRVFAEFDSRTSPSFSRRGGLYRVELSDYHQTNGSEFSFRRIDAEANQFVPVLRDNWVFALRAMVSATDTPSGSDVPYFLMPNLGGSHVLRGYPEWRFRGANRMLLSGEYRWTAGQFVDMSLFLDAGKVTDRFSDLDLTHLKESYGVGVSFHTFDATVMRVELARTGEGNALVLSFSPSF